MQIAQDTVTVTSQQQASWGDQASRGVSEWRPNN